MAKSYANLKKLNDKNGEATFEAEIPTDIVEEYVKDELTREAEHFALPGFRKGKVPENIVREHLSEMALLEAAADQALRDAMEDIVDDNALDVVGKPELTITKIAPKNPLGFQIRFALFPEVKLPDYKRVARETMERKNPAEITETDIDEAIKQIRRMMAAQSGGNADEKALPTLTDESVAQLGPFKTLADFRAEIKKQITEEKKMNEKREMRGEIMKAVTAQAKAAIPAMLLEQEWHALKEDREKHFLERNISFEDYLKQAGKTKEVFEKEERALLEEQLKTNIVFAEMRKKEAIAPERKAVEMMMSRLARRYPEESESSLQRTAEAMAIEEAMFALLENPTQLPKEKE
jgi:FKBP-type peptidyl-prolyl cis-trans isomerase (trigger factor)